MNTLHPHPKTTQPHYFAASRHRHTQYVLKPVLFGAMLLLGACSMDPYQPQTPVYPGPDTPAGRQNDYPENDSGSSYPSSDRVGVPSTKKRPYSPPTQRRDTVTESPSRETPNSPAVRYQQESLSPAAASLIKEAMVESKAGNYQLALSKAERAQRLAPRSPETYAAIGDIYYARNIRSRANQFYRKALRLASTDYARREELQRRVEATR